VFDIAFHFAPTPAKQTILCQLAYTKDNDNNNNNNNYYYYYYYYRSV